MATLATITTAGVVIGILLPLALLGVLLGGLTRENRRSLKLEREARNTMRELAISLEQRSRLSEQRRVLGSALHIGGLKQHAIVFAHAQDDAVGGDAGGALHARGGRLLRLPFMAALAGDVAIADAACV